MSGAESAEEVDSSQTMQVGRDAGSKRSRDKVPYEQSEAVMSSLKTMSFSYAVINGTEVVCEVKETAFAKPL